MLKQKFCLWWIWYLLFDNAHFQRWLAWHRRRGWELAHVGGLFFHFTRGDGTDYRYYVQVMKDFPWTEQGRACIAGVEELGAPALCLIKEWFLSKMSYVPLPTLPKPAKPTLISVAISSPCV